jgi:hypothetical protein
MPTGRAPKKKAAKAAKAKKAAKTKQAKAPKAPKVSDSVVIDAKRILLRYGAPIAALDKVSEAHRIEFAREIAKTNLPEREARLRELLAENGYTKPKA